MSDILFVTPAEKNIYEHPPLGTLLLATILKKNGITSEILPLSELSEANDFNIYVDNMVDKIASKGSRIISFYTRCDIYHIILKIAERLKTQYGSTIVFGGPQSDIVATETIRSFPFIDYICQGEGETTIVPFFSSLLKGTPDHSVDGLVYKKNGTIIQNPRPPLISDLDSIPEIDFSLIDMDNNRDKIRILPIDVGRGCPFKCYYCSSCAFWEKNYRLKSPERICAEITSLHEKYGITKFSFMHDMFTFNRKQVIAICQLLKKLDFPILWSCSARIDCIDNELIDIMVDAGLRSIFFGIETGSKRMQKLIHKNLNLDSVIPKLKYIQSKDLRTAVSFMYGFPEETSEDLSQTLYMIGEISKLNKITISTHLCTFLPGTEMTALYSKDMVFSNHFSNITGSAGVKECEDMIISHPSVFPQFFEYQTDLRQKLDHFSLFTKTWIGAQPLYQLISEKYDKDHLIDMYFDYLDCNKKILEECNTLSDSEKLQYILKYDCLPQIAFQRKNVIHKP